MLCGCALAIWFYMLADRKHRLQVLLGIVFGLVVSAAIIVVGDMLAGGLLMTRMTSFSRVDFTYEGLSQEFLRLQIWRGALSVISDNALLGIGQVNERIALQQEMAWERWFRAHQSYLSYLIAGGIPALISGLLMQGSVLAFLSAAKRSSFFPAFLGLGVVVTLNCFTDSVFQSGVGVQAFMLTTLILLRASDADHPTLAPQKQVSPDII